MSGRKALIVGIDYYESGSLNGCVNDAHSVKAVLQRHSDGTPNFDVVMLTGTGPNDRVTAADLRAKVQELFDAESSETALFYFAGHGHIEATGGYLLASDTNAAHEGLSLNDVVTFANGSGAQNRVILLDSCHSGIAGTSTGSGNTAELKEGTTILTASTAGQYAVESNGSGVFTNLLVDALSGAAGNLIGDVTPGSVYAHIDQSLGAWEQRPVFKTNVKNFVSLREVQAAVELGDLRRITEFFPSAGSEHQLDPTYEPERGPNDSSLPAPDPLKNEIFAILQQFNRVNLVVPVDAPHMYHAAINSKSCKLTVLGEHYRRLVENDRI